MCGIAGIAGQNPEVSRAAVARMCARMLWRGPDEGGLFEADDIVLGHRRLRILDLSPAASQPLTSSHGRVSVVFNGEIYNFRQLRHILETLGHRFRGTGDTEVLLHCYLEYGLDFLTRLEGMFALGLYDPRSKKLILARDPLGIKPLYFWQRDRVLAFASEIRALKASGLPGRELDGACLAQTLMLGAPLAGRTPWAEIRSLPPGEWLVWSDSRTAQGRYWSFPSRSSSRVTPAEVAATVQKVVTEHLVSDVPVGLLLSGGLDSSALAALVTKLSSRPLRTFTLGFPDSPLDESAFAQEVASHLKTEHTVIPVTADNILADVESFLEASDFPSIDGLNIYMVCKYVRQAGVVVLLSGQGGDEAFAGYSTFRQLPRLERVLRWWRLLPRCFRKTGRLFARGSLVGPLAKLAALLEGSTCQTESYLLVRAVMMPRLLQELLAPALLAALEKSIQACVRDVALEAQADDPVTSVAMLESRIYLHDTLLRLSDVHSMAHSLELRVPFVDKRVCEMTNRALPSERIRAGIPKPMLLSLVRDNLPTTCWQRAKGCFHLPVGRWLVGPLRQRVQAVLHETQLGDVSLFHSKALHALWNRLEAEPDSVPLAHAVWGVYTLGEWLRRNAGPVTVVLPGLRDKCSQNTKDKVCGFSMLHPR